MTDTRPEFLFKPTFDGHHQLAMLFDRDGRQHMLARTPTQNDAVGKPTGFTSQLYRYEGQGQITKLGHGPRRIEQFLGQVQHVQRIRPVSTKFDLEKELGGSPHRGADADLEADPTAGGALSRHNMNQPPAASGFELNHIV